VGVPGPHRRTAHVQSEGGSQPPSCTPPSLTAASLTAPKISPMVQAPGWRRLSVLSSGAPRVPWLPVPGAATLAELWEGMQVAHHG